MNNSEMVASGGSFLIQQTNMKNTFFPEDLTEEHRMIQKTAQQFITKEVHPWNKEIEEQQDFDVVVQLLKKAGSLGLLAHSIPKKYGGLGLDKISKGIVGEALGSAGGYSAAHSNHTCIATLPITYYGTEEQKEKHLPKLASGEYIGAYCLTEPEAGSDAMAAKTTAVLNDEKTHYLLNGTKIYITNAEFSDTFIVYAKVDGDQFTAFIVEKDFPGLSLGSEEKKMGIKGSSTRSVIFEDCEVPINNVIGEIGKGHIVAFTVLNLGRFNLGSACTGGAKYAFKQTVEHVRERKQFNQAIADFGATKEKIAIMAARLYAAESIQYQTSYLLENSLANLDQSEDASLVRKGMSEYAIECAICKVYGSETLDHLADEGVQLHGGVGFISEYPIEQIYRDSRINRIFEGTNEVNRLLLTGEFLKRSMKGLLPYKEAVKKSFVQIAKDSNNETENLVEDLRALYIILTEFARKKYEDDLESQQEVLIKLSDLAIQLYASESVVLRTKKSDQNTELKKALRDTVLEDALNQSFIIVRLLEKDLLENEPEIRNQIYSSLMSYSFLKSIQRNRKIAEEMYRKGEYIN